MYKRRNVESCESCQLSQRSSDLSCDSSLHRVKRCERFVENCRDISSSSCPACSFSSSCSCCCSSSCSCCSYSSSFCYCSCSSSCSCYSFYSFYSSHTCILLDIESRSLRISWRFFVQRMFLSVVWASNLGSVFIYLHSVNSDFCCC